MDNVNVSDNIEPVTAETAEAEQQKDTAAQKLGKFESVDALLNAYKSLEAEFTRRSQRLKELEEGNKARNMQGALSQDATKNREDFVNAAKNDVEVKEAVIGEYLKTVFNGKTVPLIVGGVSTPAPKNRPQSVKEAGALVKNFLKD